MLARLISWSALLLVLHVGQGYAGEIMAHGKVVRVVPISAKSHVMERAGDCEPAKPHDAGLAALLAWDLRVACHTIRRETEMVDGYRVYYEWDDRVYDTVMSRAPADTIPLRVSVH
ncbi:MAG: hypothetical protein OES38_06040 [Gammaproteobacteria bacterium]|nr:hypothetical protein [Gammaproteobacteria bacterium]